MSMYTDQINKIYRMAKNVGKTSIRSFSQVGETYDPKKFGFEQAHTAHIDGKPKEARMSNDANTTKWTQPLSVKQLASMFKVHRNTMRKWLVDQVIKNEQLSPRKWRIAYSELPQDFVDCVSAHQ